MDCFLILPKGIKFLRKFVHFEKDILEDILLKILKIESASATYLSSLTIVNPPLCHDDKIISSFVLRETGVYSSSDPD